MKEIPKEIMDKIDKAETAYYGEPLKGDYKSTFKQGAIAGYQLADCEYWKKRCEELEKGLSDLINQYEMLVTEKFNQLAMPFDLDELPTLFKAKNLLSQEPR